MPPRITGAVIADVDLAGAELERLTFDQCTLTNVRFDGATLNDIGFVGCDVVACSFDRARILGGALSVGAVNKFLPVPVSTAGRFTDCSFDRAVVDDPVCSRAIFRRCRFTAGTVRSVIFSGCVFHDVTFSGRVRQVEFDGRVPFEAEPDWDRAELVDVDFSGATRFDDVEFHDVGLTRVSWPARVRHLAFTGDVPGFFAFAATRLHAIAADERLVLDIMVQWSVEGARAGQNQWFVHTASYGDRTEDFYLQLAERHVLALATEYGPAIEVTLVD